MSCSKEVTEAIQYRLILADVRSYKGEIPQPRHVDIEPKVPVRKPVLVNKPNKTSLKVEVPLKKDKSAPQVETISCQVVKPPKD